MLEGFDYLSSIEGFNRDYVLTDECYEDVKQYIVSYLTKFDTVSFEKMTSSKILRTLNFDFGLEYCCLSFNHNVFCFKNFYVPENLRGCGILTNLVKGIEPVLRKHGIGFILFENVINEDLARHFLNDGFERYYFNFPKEDEDRLTLIDCLKVIG